MKQHYQSGRAQQYLKMLQWRERSVCYFTFAPFIHIPHQHHADTRPVAQETGEHASSGQGAEPVKHLLLLVREKMVHFQASGKFS